MSARRSPERAPSRSGSYVHEAQRHTERVVLRLPHDVAEALRERAAKQGATVSGYVSELVRTK